MPLFTVRAPRDYAASHMPQAEMSDGPWGEAIRYWLNQRKMRQADLAGLTGIRANTISRATRGFHTTTRVLSKIAVAFRVPIDVVLVSPERKLANEDRRRLAVEISERVLRELEGPPRAGDISPTLQPTIDALEEAVEVEEALVRSRDQRRVSKHTTPKKKRSRM